MQPAVMNLPQRVLTSLVRGYRLVLSPWLGSSCRFEPTCSVYSLQAIETHGAAVGTYMTLQRLARCHPWCPGGHDPVPEHSPVPFRAFSAGARARTGAISSSSTEKSSP